jgi:hypothetical protein
MVAAHIVTVQVNTLTITIIVPTRVPVRAATFQGCIAAREEEPDVSVPMIPDQLPAGHFPTTAAHSVPIEINGIAASISIEICLVCLAVAIMIVAAPALWRRWACLTTVSCMPPDLDVSALCSAAAAFRTATPTTPSIVTVHRASVGVA